MKIAGRHLATCFMVADMGTRFYDDGVHTHARKEIVFGWELVDRLRQAGPTRGARLQIVESYAWRISPRSKLRRHLEAWLNAGVPPMFNIFSLVGRSCVLELERGERNGRRWHYVARIAPSPHNIDWAPTAPTIALSLTADRFDPIAFHRLSDHLRARIIEAPEWSALHGAAPPLPGEDVSSDHIPY